MVISHGWLDNLPWSLDQSYLCFLGDISTRSTTTLHDTVDAVDQNIWPRFKIHDTSVSSMLLSFLASRICRAIRSAIFLRMLASWHVANPGKPAGCQVFNVYMSEVRLTHINIYIYIYLHMNIYDHIWRIYIYIIYEYRLGYKVDVFIIRTTKGKIRKLTTKYWYFRVLEFEMHIIIPWSEDDWYTIMWYNMTQVYREKVYSMYMFISL